MFGQILVPLDGSAFAEGAIPIARQLATRTNALAQLGGCTVHLVRVVDLVAWAPWGPAGCYICDDLVRTEERHASDYLESMRTQLEADGLAVRTACADGPVVEALVRYEQEARIDLVVMCSHLRQGWSRLAHGSVAERLLREGAAPVLLARTDAPDVDLQRLVVALDGTESGEAALCAVENLARYVAEEVTLVRAVPDRSQYDEEERYLCWLAQRVGQRHIRCNYRIEQGDPAAAILAAAGAGSLVVMTSHGRSSLARWAGGSIVDRVTHGGAAAVLLTHCAQHQGIKHLIKASRAVPYQGRAG